MSARTSRTSSSSCCRPPTTMSSGRSAASSISTRSTRSAASRTTPRSPATCRARACSRRCSRSWKAPSPRCRRRAAASIRSRSSCRSTRPTSCSSAAAPSPGLEKIIAARGQGTSIGFGAEVRAPDERRDRRDPASEVEPEDLLKFGLIPEFVGRLPVIATLEDLDEQALVEILTEPKNALVKQYQRLFEMEGVQLDLHRGRAAVDRPEGDRSARPARAACARSWKASCSNTMFELPGLRRRRGGRHQRAKWSRAGASPLYIYADRRDRGGIDAPELGRERRRSLERPGPAHAPPMPGNCYNPVRGTSPAAFRHDDR